MWVCITYLKDRGSRDVVVVEDAIEGAVHAIIDIVHVGVVLSPRCPFLLLVESLADHVDSNGMSGAGKVTA